MTESTGCRPMAPLNACRVCSPTEDLHTSWEEPSIAHRTKQKSKSSLWYLASWNVRSLIDKEGSFRTANDKCERQISDERRIDQVVNELGRYGMMVAALQETKWFGKEVYRVGDSVVLTAGRPVPAEGQARKRGEGVAIVLCGKALHAWKAGGSIWKPWSSRLVTATLALGKGHLHIMSCYAPMYASSRAEKDEFFDDLQQALSAIPSTDNYVMLGDFNARVGSRQDGDEWWNVRGPHGIGETNEAGKELLTFLSMNEATVCNTWYEKKRIYKATWQHPKTKWWHCIDYAIVKQGYRRWCKDVAVVRGAECNTDHHMLRMKLDVRMKAGPRRSQERGCSKGRFDVAKLQGASVDEEGEMTIRGKYQQRVGEGVNRAWDGEGSVEEKWEVMKAALCESAQLLLGRTKRRDPDWFQESIQILKPFLEERNRMYAKWLGSKKESDWRKFLKLRREARRAVREAKNEWFLRKAAEAQRGRHGGKVVWSCIRDMQRGRRGLVPVRVAAVKDEEGNPCRTSEEQQQRWRRHLHRILNVQSLFDETQLENARQRPIRQHMDHLPSREEVERAVRKLKHGKAGGNSGILPEMVSGLL